MAHWNRTPMASLEGWSHKAFLLAGTLLLFTAVVYAVDLTTSMALQGMLTGIPSLAGLLVAYVGLVGLYPRLVKPAPRLARAGVLLVLVPAVAILFVLAVGVLSLFAELPEPPFVGTLFVMVFVGFALGITLLGVASVQSRVPSRRVGYYLLLFAVPWFVLVGTSTVYGAEQPAWLEFATMAVLGATGLAIGANLWKETKPRPYGGP